MTAAAPEPKTREKGLESVMVRLWPRQAQALRREAMRRAAERGSGKPDASEVLRDVLDGRKKAGDVGLERHELDEK